MGRRRSVRAYSTVCTYGMLTDMTQRITITLPDELVDELDLLAQAADLSRSGIIREASARYVTDARGAAATRHRTEAVQDTLGLLEELRAASALDERPTRQILREMRGPLDEMLEPEDTP
jgi:predicted transcriptional regulator